VRLARLVRSVGLKGSTGAVGATGPLVRSALRAGLVRLVRLARSALRVGLVRLARLARSSLPAGLMRSSIKTYYMCASKAKCAPRRVSWGRVNTGVLGSCGHRSRRF
jgi:hypothetical protein